MQLHIPATAALKAYIVHLVHQDSSLESSLEGIDQTQDQYGTLAPRNSWLVMERTLLCQALLYAVYLSQEVLKSETVRELVDLVDYTSLRLKVPAGASSSRKWEPSAYAPIALLVPATRAGLLVLALQIGTVGLRVVGGSCRWVGGGGWVAPALAEVGRNGVGSK
jgi:hypothetical protein